MSAVIPIPRIPIAVRAATPADLPFLDSVQKLHTTQVGWMPKAQLEAKIAAGDVLVAERDAAGVGYCIANDRYFKRDDVGIVYQLAVAPQARRGLVGAALLKAQFERSAYGCRLYCCWCAQDIEANRFWEAMGFVPLAYRAGSKAKGRVHIFWQRRIRAGDATTPWWFPAKTDAGAMREDRLVLPIPPGRHWSDEMPALITQDTKALPHAGTTGAGKLVPGTKARPQAPTPRGRAKAQFGPPPARPTAETRQPAAPPPAPTGAERAKPPRVRVKADPKLVALARELRDRWLEQVNTAGDALLPHGKYDVSRIASAVEGSRARESKPLAAGAIVVNAVPALPAPLAA